MIYGDPFIFSIQFDVVRDWTDSCFWVNGLFSLFVCGERLLDVVDVVELKTAVNFYAKMEFENIEEGDPAISAKELFASAHRYFFKGESAILEGVQDITCTFLGGAPVCLFIFKKQRMQTDWSGVRTLATLFMRRCCLGGQLLA
ncbi:Imm42 family immunity protein [Pseudomonas sp. Sample_20]|uniref:Imm42 family immunity protein n=1 Tax=Pseudomonas sp. Sample_20 TaxID=2448264 RepID=UPI001032D65A|nr:Imm42 family immunity protein [Pseudomonas sp. Sample_20]